MARIYRRLTVSCMRMGVLLPPPSPSGAPLTRSYISRRVRASLFSIMRELLLTCNSSGGSEPDLFSCLAQRIIRQYRPSTRSDLSISRPSLRLHKWHQRQDSISYTTLSCRRHSSPGKHHTFNPPQEPLQLRPDKTRIQPPNSL